MPSKITMLAVTTAVLLSLFTIAGVKLGRATCTIHTVAAPTYTAFLNVGVFKGTKPP